MRKKTSAQKIHQTWNNVVGQYFLEDNQRRSYIREYEMYEEKLTCDAIYI